MSEAKKEVKKEEIPEESQVKLEVQVKETPVKEQPDEYGLFVSQYKTGYEYEAAKEVKRLAEKVMVQLPKDNENYKDDVTVCINGKIWQIQRGVMVSVPRAVAEILSQSMNQMLIADQKMASANNIYLGDR